MTKKEGSSVLMKCGHMSSGMISIYNEKDEKVFIPYCPSCGCSEIGDAQTERIEDEQNSTAHSVQDEGR